MSSSVFGLLATQGLGSSLFFRSQLLLSPCAAVRRNCKVPCGGWDCGSFDLWGQKLKYHLGQHSVLGSKAGNRFRAPSVSNQSQRWVKIFLGAVEGWHLFLGLSLLVPASNVQDAQAVQDGFLCDHQLNVMSYLKVSARKTAVRICIDVFSEIWCSTPTPDFSLCFPQTYFLSSSLRLQSKETIRVLPRPLMSARSVLNGQVNKTGMKMKKDTDAQ